MFSAVSCSEQQASNEKERGLSTDHAKEFQKEIIKIEDNIYVAIGYALANVIMIVGDSENVIVDTTGSEEAAQIVKKELNKNLSIVHHHRARLDLSERVISMLNSFFDNVFLLNF